MNTSVLITIVVSIVLVIIGIVLVVKKERFTGTAVIHPIIMSQAPQSVQDSNTNMNNIISIFVSNIGKDDEIVTRALSLLSAIEEQNGIPAGDFFTGDYTGLWTCVNNGTMVVWTFNKVPGVPATTFPSTNTLTVKLPTDLTNTYWSCRPNHAVGVPTLLRLNLSPVSMSVWDGTTWS